MPQRLSMIQILRSLGAYLVLLLHLSGHEAVHGGDQTPILRHQFFEIGGTAGVDLFFVISGFIMAYVTVGLPHTLSSAGRFLTARLFRIYPIWWLFLGIQCLMMVAIFGHPWHPEQVATDSSGPMLFLKSIFLVPQASLPVLGVGWTLVHEQYFYIVFAGLLLLPRKWLPLALLLWASLPLFALFTDQSTHRAADLWRLITHAMTIEFIAGALVGWIFTRGVRVLPGPIFLIGLFSFFAAIMFVPPELIKQHAEMRVLIFILPCILLVYGAAGLSQSKRLPSQVDKASMLGDWSYSLYLSHPIVLVLLRKSLEVAADLTTKAGLPEDLSSALRLGAPGLTDNIIFISLALIVSTLVSLLSYRFVERPLIVWFKARRAKAGSVRNEREIEAPPL